ncbi:MAG: MerR family transcriptional regulator [Nannocystales bacterium]
MSKQRLTVQAVAELSGVTPRALHYYDEIGLLSPARGKADYRIYSSEDLLRLQQILIYRELGLPLQRIKALLDEPGFSPERALEEQRVKLAQRAEATARMLASVDQALARLRGDARVEPASLFDGFEPERYEREVEERWGGTEAYAESRRRTQSYSEEDWVRIKGEADAILRRVAAAVERGDSPSSTEGNALADAYRLHIDRYFYPCPPHMFREVASRYTSDDRFTKNLNRFGDGVAAFLEKAASANIGR